MHKLKKDNAEMKKFYYFMSTRFAPEGWLRRVRRAKYKRTDYGSRNTAGRM
jgi:hypothetical protein